MYAASPGEFARDQFDELSEGLTDESEPALRAQVAILAALVAINEGITEVAERVENIDHNIADVAERVANTEDQIRSIQSDVNSMRIMWH